MATLYCGPTSAGSANGSNFSNRMVLPDGTGWVRGNEYVIIGSATGYGNRDLNTAASSTSTITIRKANAAQDSGVTGWSSDFGTLRANLGRIVRTTDYWVINGVSRDENDWLDDSAYGIHCSEIFQRNLDGETAGNHLSVSYVDIGAAYSQSFSSGQGVVFYMGGFSAFIQDISLDHCFLHNWSAMQAAGVDGLTVEYCAFAAGWGKEAIRGQIRCRNVVIRYCLFYNSTQTDPDDPTSGATAEIAIWDGDTNGDFDNIEIYGNVIWNDKSINHSGGTIVVGGGSGWVGVAANNVAVYNNTISGIASGTANILINGGTGNASSNNLWYNCVGTPSSTPNTSSNGEIGSDIFVSVAGGNFRLTENTAAGATLSSPYNEDMDGIERGSNGEDWSRGAFQFNGDPPPPENINVNATNWNVGTLTIG